MCCYQLFYINTIFSSFLSQENLLRKMGKLRFIKCPNWKWQMPIFDILNQSQLFQQELGSGSVRRRVVEMVAWTPDLRLRHIQTILLVVTISHQDRQPLPALQCQWDINLVLHVIYIPDFYAGKEILLFYMLASSWSKR